MEKRKKRRWPWLLAMLALVLILLGLDYWNLLPHRTYTAEHFGIETLQSPLDADGDGVDDYTDLMLGARQDAENHPAYDPGYFAGGYPPEDRGVCTDVVWRAFQNAGYDLKALIDADIAENTVDFTPNYDNKLQEPTVLPAAGAGHARSQHRFPPGPQFAGVF